MIPPIATLVVLVHSCENCIYRVKLPNYNLCEYLQNMFVILDQIPWSDVASNSIKEI